MDNTIQNWSVIEAFKPYIVLFFSVVVYIVLFFSVVVLPRLEKSICPIRAKGGKSNIVSYTSEWAIQLSEM